MKSKEITRQVAIEAVGTSEKLISEVWHGPTDSYRKLQVLTGRVGWGNSIEEDKKNQLEISIDVMQHGYDKNGKGYSRSTFNSVCLSEHQARALLKVLLKAYK